MTGLATLLLLLVPFIPGLRDIPRWIPVHRLIWRVPAAPTAMPAPPDGTPPHDGKTTRHRLDRPDRTPAGLPRSLISRRKGSPSLGGPAGKLVAAEL